MSDERLVHFTNTPATALHSDWHGSGYGKPRGFWVSVEGNGDGWSDWCQENFGLGTYEQEVTLSEDANILWIRNGGELDDFTARWRSPADEPFAGIDWAGVARTWQGVFITPYLWSRRLDMDSFWYYCWDCASGCVWDTNAVSLGPARQRQVLEP